MKRPWVVALFVVLGLVLLAAIAGLVALRSATSRASLEKRFNESLQASTEGLYRVELGSTSYSLSRRSFTFGHFRVAPDSLELERRREAGSSPEIEFTLEADALRLDGIDWRALAGGDIAIATATLESPVARAFLNRKAPSKGGSGPARMPNELLAQIPRSVRIDTLSVKNGSMHYSELARDGARPGTIRFESVSVAVYDLVSHPKPGFEAPCRIDLRMLLAGEGETEITLIYDLSSPRLDLEYQGRIGRMPATAFNEILPDLEGLRVNSGVHDSTWFEFDVKGDVATGKVQVLYHDLDSELIKKGSHEQGFSENLQTFIGNAFKIQSENPPGDGSPAIVVPVQRERPESENFFRFLWVIVRSGLFVTLGIA